MTNQDIVDRIDTELCGTLEPELLDRLLNVVWDFLGDNRDDSEESE